MVNSIYKSPNFSLHRELDAPAADSSDLAALLASLGVGPDGVPIMVRKAANAAGWDTVDGYVEFDGGTAPSVTLQPLLARKFVQVSGGVMWRLVPLANTSALTHGQPFSVTGTNQGRVLMRVHAVTGSPTALRIMLAGGARANEGSI